MITGESLYQLYGNSVSPRCLHAILSIWKRSFLIVKVYLLKPTYFNNGSYLPRVFSRQRRRENCNWLLYYTYWKKSPWFLVSIGLQDLSTFYFHLTEDYWKFFRCLWAVRRFRRLRRLYRPNMTSWFESLATMLCWLFVEISVYYIARKLPEVTDSIGLKVRFLWKFAGLAIFDDWIWFGRKMKSQKAMTLWRTRCLNVDFEI